MWKREKKHRQRVRVIEGHSHRKKEKEIDREIVWEKNKVSWSDAISQPKHELTSAQAQLKVKRKQSDILGKCVGMKHIWKYKEKSQQKKRQLLYKTKSREEAGGCGTVGSITIPTSVVRI